MKKAISVSFILFMFIISTIFFTPHNKIYKVDDVISPIHLIINSKDFHIKNLSTFDTTYSEYNKALAKELGITETEAFILGNFGKYWALNLIKGHSVFIKDNDLIFIKNSYKTKFEHSGFCLYNNKPFSQEAFDKRIAGIRKGKFKILDLDNETIYKLDDPKTRTLKHFLVLRQTHLPPKDLFFTNDKTPALLYKEGNIKIVLTDSTGKLKSNLNCNTEVCKEILDNINNAKESIDIAIYGYSKIPAIENAIKNAIKRGVKIRLVYDLDSSGNNIYEDTDALTKIITDNKSDKLSSESKNIMHNKLYIFDKNITITGSANLSNTDMSGFNSNSVAVINSPEIAQIYTAEFEQMYKGYFHNEKKHSNKKQLEINGTRLEIYFSPQDKPIENAIIPLINNAEKYIYIPTFVLTNKQVTEALGRAKLRGVDVKIILDALNASVKHTKHNELRKSGIQVKTENHAGKMHSKSMIIDDKYTIIGSMNFSYSGENKNDENLIIITNPKIAKFYKEFFLYQWNNIDNKWLIYNARAEGKDSPGSCSDGIDNDYDGFVDAFDPACK